MNMSMFKIWIALCFTCLVSIMMVSSQKPRLRAYRGLQTRGYMPLTISTARGFGKRNNPILDGRPINWPQGMIEEMMEALQESDNNPEHPSQTFKR